MQTILDVFVNSAWAEGGAPPPSQGGGISMLVLMVVFFIAFYFLLIRPQLKQAKEHRNLVGALTENDEIVTTGGMAGKIAEVGDNFILLEVASNVRIKIEKHAVAKSLPVGSLKIM